MERELFEKSILYRLVNKCIEKKASCEYEGYKICYKWYHKDDVNKPLSFIGNNDTDIIVITVVPCIYSDVVSSENITSLGMALLQWDHLYLLPPAVATPEIYKEFCATFGILPFSYSCPTSIRNPDYIHASKYINPYSCTGGCGYMYIDGRPRISRYPSGADVCHCVDGISIATRTRTLDTELIFVASNSDNVIERVLQLVDKNVTKYVITSRDIDRKYNIIDISDMSKQTFDGNWEYFVRDYFYVDETRFANTKPSKRHDKSVNKLTD